MKKSLIASAVLLVFMFSARPVNGASTTLGAVPANGLFYAPFNVALVIDGHGDIFNAARAKIELPDTLSVQSIIPGDCHFTYTHPPTATNPSFEGVILGSSATKCSVYTLVLIPTQSGTATVHIANATVRRYGDAVEVLSTIEPGNYTLDLQTPTSTASSSSDITTLLPSAIAVAKSDTRVKTTPDLQRHVNLRYVVTLEAILFAIAGLLSLIYLFISRKKK